MDTLSLTQLEEYVSAQKQEVADIKLNISEIKVKLAECENRLAVLTGVKQLKKGDQPPLRQFIVKALSESNEPLTIDQIANLVLEAGYITSSIKNFRHIVYNILSSNADFKQTNRPKVKPYRYTL
jgi:hypothetical protein